MRSCYVLALLADLLREVTVTYRFTFAPRLRDVNLKALRPRHREQFPHLPGGIQAGDHVELLVPQRPGKDGRHTAVGLREMRKFREVLDRKMEARAPERLAAFTRKRYEPPSGQARGGGQMVSRSATGGSDHGAR